MGNGWIPLKKKYWQYFFRTKYLVPFFNSFMLPNFFPSAWTIKSNLDLYESMPDDYYVAAFFCSTAAGNRDIHMRKVEEIKKDTK